MYRYVILVQKLRFCEKKILHTLALEYEHFLHVYSFITQLILLNKRKKSQSRPLKIIKQCVDFPKIVVIQKFVKIYVIRAQ